MVDDAATGASREIFDLRDFNVHDQAVIQMAQTAMLSGSALQFEYDGEPRLVEVHAIGVSTAGRPCIRAYQVTGGSKSGETEAWKMFSVNKIFEFPRLMSIHSLAPREGYQKGDKGMSTIFREI